MSMTNAAEQAFLDLLFLNTDWAAIGDAGGLQNSALAVEIAESVIDKAKEQAKATDKRNRAALLAWMLLR